MVKRLTWWSNMQAWWEYRPRTPVMTGADALEKFPVFQRRFDKHLSKHIYQPDVISTLVEHFGDRNTTIIGDQMPISPSASNLADVLKPDLMVSFNCDPALAQKQGGYAIDRQGKPPDFVLEVAAPEDTLVGEIYRREEYGWLGISEHWLLDTAHVSKADGPLMAYRLIEGTSVHKFVHLELLRPDFYRIFSEALGLYICWDKGKLRFYDERTKTYL